MGSGQVLTLQGQLPGQDQSVQLPGMVEVQLPGQDQSGHGQLLEMGQLPAPGQGQLTTQGHG
jgi:hypothetical protein